MSKPRPPDGGDFAATMWLSACAHAWVIGLAWHFYLESLQLGPWFWLPFLITIVPTWVIGAAGFGWLGEKLGWWGAPEPNDHGNVSG